jgi:hypothetical protein
MERPPAVEVHFLRLKRTIFAALKKSSAKECHFSHHDNENLPKQGSLPPRSCVLIASAVDIVHVLTHLGRTNHHHPSFVMEEEEEVGEDHDSSCTTSSSAIVDDEDGDEDSDEDSSSSVLLSLPLEKQQQQLFVLQQQERHRRQLLAQQPQQQQQQQLVDDYEDDDSDEEEDKDDDDSSSVLSLSFEQQQLFLLQQQEHHQRQLLAQQHQQQQQQQKQDDYDYEEGEEYTDDDDDNEENDDDDDYCNVVERTDYHYEYILRGLQLNQVRSFCIRERWFDEVYAGWQFNLSNDNNDSIIDVDTSRCCSPWTLAQWNALFATLLLNTSVEIVNVELKFIHADALGILVDYIQTSRHVKHVTIQYVSTEKDEDYFLNNGDIDDDDDDTGMPLFIPQAYQDVIADLLYAARQNSSIQHVTVGCLSLENIVHRHAIRNLLSTTTTTTTTTTASSSNKGSNCSNLISFTLRLHHLYCQASFDMARAIASGLCANHGTLQHVALSVTQHLDVILSGLCHDDNDNDGTEDDDDTDTTSCFSNLESLHLCTNQSRVTNGELGDKILQVIRRHRHLKKLVVEESEFLFDKDIWSDFVSSDNDDNDSTTHDNHDDMRIMIKKCAPFAHAGSQLRQICLRVRNHDNNSNKSDDEHYREHGSRFLANMLQVAKNMHELQDLTLYAEGDSNDNSASGACWIPSVRVLLQELLQTTTSLRKLSIHDFGQPGELATGVADGLRKNKSLGKLLLKLQQQLPQEPQQQHGNSNHNRNTCMQASHYCMILQSLADANTTLRELETPGNLIMTSLHKVNDREDNHGNENTNDNGNDNDLVNICNAIVHLFQNTRSLRHIQLPALQLKAPMMRRLIKGLATVTSTNSTSLKSIDMRNCQTDDAGFELLVQALVVDDDDSNNNSIRGSTLCLEHIALPRLADDSRIELDNFILAISRMKRIKSIDFLQSIPFQKLDHGADISPSDFANLLLHVVQENKQLSSLGNVMTRLKYSCGSAGEPGLYCPRVVANIEFFLKVNAFGRHGLENDDEEDDNENSNNNINNIVPWKQNCRDHQHHHYYRGLLPSLWPVILARMSTKPDNADALFYFIHKYFRKNYYAPLLPQPPQQKEQQQGQPCAPSPLKKAKLEEFTNHCVKNKRVAIPFGKSNFE